MSKRDDSSHDTKEKIFSAAAKLFAMKGYDAASVRDIASEAGVNLALINYHFKDKRQLLICVIERGMDFWSEMLELHQGESLEKLLTYLMTQATDFQGTAYYLNIFMRMFLDTSMDIEIKKDLYIKGAPKIEILHRAVAKELGKINIDQECVLIGHYLINNLIFSSRIRFGIDPKILHKSYLSEVFPGKDASVEQLLDLSRRLCRV